MSLNYVLLRSGRVNSAVDLGVLPVILPFVISFAAAKHVIPTSSGYTRLYAGVLVLGTALGIWRICLGRVGWKCASYSRRHGVWFRLRCKYNKHVCTESSRCLTKRSRRHSVIASHAGVPLLAKPRSAGLSANVRHLGYMAARILLALLVGSLWSWGSGADTDPTSPPLPFYLLGRFDTDAHLKAAVELQSLGRDRALARLHQIAADPYSHISSIALCRMLFTMPPPAKFRPPRLGLPSYLGGTSSSDWPLEPLEIVDGVPFVIVEAYTLGGFPEPEELYLRYCESNAEWSNFQFTIKTKQQEEKALLKLIFESPKWRRPLYDSDRDFLWKQIE